MDLPAVQAPMVRAFVLALALTMLVLAPPAQADVAQGRAVPGHAAGMPQLFCALAQTSPHSGSDYGRCDARGPLTAATFLRVRIEGVGNAFVWVLDERTREQVAEVNCVASTASPVTLCSFPLRGGSRTAADVSLHVLAQGPGAASSVAWVENSPLPVATP